MSDWRDRFQAVERQVLALQVERGLRSKQLDDLVAEVKQLTETELLLGRVEQTLLHVSSSILGQSVSSIDQLVTQGLRLVFDDQKLTFSTRIDRLRGKTGVRFELDSGGVVAPLTESYGGGVLSVVGLLLRVVTIMTLKMRRVIMLDETLAHLSNAYVPNASNLIRQLCAQLDFTIIMVTHEADFTVHADRTYRVKNSGGATTFEKA
jgi:DNA repair ATPase RecN